MVTAERLDRRPWRDKNWLVLSPHADDETLGAGALIAQASAVGRLKSVTYLTDGAGSHPAGTRGIVGIRRREASRALRRLSREETQVDWLGWRDAHPPAPGSALFTRAAMMLGARLRRLAIDAVAVSAQEDAHCDHVAAYDLAQAAITASRRSVALFAYHVWSAPSAKARCFSTAAMPIGRRRHALRAHRSQLSNIYGEGFRLERAHRAMRAFDLLYLQDGRS